MVGKISRVQFEDALNMTGFGKFNLLMFTLACAIISAMVFEMYSVSYVVPGSACEMNTTSAEQGLAAGLPLIGVITTSHLWGYLADKHGRRKMLIFSMAISFITGTLASLSPNWIVLCILKILSSAAVSGASALSVALLGECTPVKQRSILLLLTTSAFLLSTAIMSVLSIPVLPLQFSYYIPVLNIHFNSWRLLNLIFTIPAALSFFGAITSCESPKFLLSVGEEEEALAILKNMYVFNSGKSSELYEVQSIVLDEDNITEATKGFWASIVAQTVPLFKPPLLKGTLLLGLLFTMVFICVNTFVVWLPMLSDAFISSVQTGATGLTICEMIRLNQNSLKGAIVEDCSMNNVAMSMVCGISLVLAALNVVTGLAINCVGKRRLFIFIQMLSGIAALCISASPFWILSAVLLLTLMANILNFGFLSSFTVDIFPTCVKAKAVCLMLMLGRGSTILGINVMKQMIDNNCEAVFYIFGALTICAGVLGFLLPADRPFFKQQESSVEK